LVWITATAGEQRLYLHMVLAYSKNDRRGRSKTYPLCFSLPPQPNININNS
jgi:hypothetical protein